VAGEKATRMIAATVAAEATEDAAEIAAIEAATAAHPEAATVGEIADHAAIKNRDGSCYVMNFDSRPR